MDSSFLLSVPPLMKDEEPGNWAELPSELLSSILLRLGIDDILKSVQKVCRSWRRVCKEPLMWRKIDMRSLQGFSIPNVHSLCRHVVDLSQGGLLEINISRTFSSNDFLTYIAHRSSNLRSLALEINWSMTNEAIVNAVAKLPLLETLEISGVGFKLDLKAIGKACTQLQRLKLDYMHASMKPGDDYYAIAIAESMSQLRHLEIIGSRLSNTGLNYIIFNLLHLEHLYLDSCFHITVAGNFDKQSLERMKELRRTNDSTVDCHFVIISASSDSDDD